MFEQHADNSHKQIECWIQGETQPINGTFSAPVYHIETIKCHDLPRVPNYLLKKTHPLSLTSPYLNLACQVYQLSATPSYLYAHTNIRIWIYVYIYICTYVNIHAYRHTYKHTCMHTYIHTSMHPCHAMPYLTLPYPTLPWYIPCIPCKLGIPCIPWIDYFTLRYFTLQYIHTYTETTFKYTDF